MKSSNFFMKRSVVLTRIMIKQYVVAFSLFFMVIFGTQQALAMSDDVVYEYLDFHQYTGNRMMVFNDTSIDYCITQNEENPLFNHIAANAIKTWHHRIVETTNNPLVWDMGLHVFPKNESVCDGYINYVDVPDPTIFQISGVAGFSHPLTSVANVTIYTDDYQSTILHMAEKDENFWDNLTLKQFNDIIKNGNHKQFDYDTINRITLHEIGHSLSLNHPVISDGNLQNAPGIMGYNMSYTQIDDEEVINIVKAYPNGFSKISENNSIKLDNPTSNQKIYLGDIANLTIELPYKEGNTPPTGIEVYIFPEGTVSQSTENAPIKILKTDGMNHVVNEGEYLEDLRVSMTHWDTFTKVLSIQFKTIKEFENADMIIVAHDMGGFEEQWFLNDVLSVEKALFSNLLLDLEVTEYTYHLMSSNPNRDIEKDFVFETKQKKMFNESLSNCLTKKNMKKCNEEIKLDDFAKEDVSIPIWMPLTLLMK